MVNLTASLVEICDYLYDLVDINKGALGVEGLFYGDQDRLPVTPAVCIEPDEKPRMLKGAQRMTLVEFHVYFLIYYSRVGSPQDNRRAADKLAEDIEALVHSKRSLDGRVIHGMCTSVSSGYVRKESTLIRASRITYEAQSQELLPSIG